MQVYKPKNKTFEAFKIAWAIVWIVPFAVTYIVLRAIAWIGYGVK